MHAAGSNCLAGWGQCLKTKLITCYWLKPASGCSTLHEQMGLEQRPPSLQHFAKYSVQDYFIYTLVDITLVSLEYPTRHTILSALTSRIQTRHPFLAGKPARIQTSSIPGSSAYELSSCLTANTSVFHEPFHCPSTHMQNGGPLQNLYELTISPNERKKMLATGVSPADNGTSEITNTKGSRDANAKYSATGHDLERILKFKSRVTVTILVVFIPPLNANHIMYLLCKLFDARTGVTATNSSVLCLQRTDGQRLFSLLKQLFQHSGLIISYVSTQRHNLSDNFR